MYLFPGKKRSKYPMNPSKQYFVAGILVEAVKSEGGGFYELTVVKTGNKQRYLAEVFEMVAKPVTRKDGGS